MQTEQEWMKDRVAYLKGLKSPSDQQKLLVLLAEKPNRDAQDEKKLSALVRAEKATERAQKARANAAKIINAEKSAERAARDHELYKAAGLLGLAGLVDVKTGKPTRDRGELLGALMGLAEANITDEKRAEWKRKGDAKLAESSR